MKKILAILFIMLIIPISCSAALTIKCDKQNFDPITSIHYLDGNVSVQIGNIFITANNAQVDLYSMKVSARGDIRLIQDAIVLTGDSVLVYFEEKTADVTGNINFTQGKINVNAEKASFNWSNKDAIFEGNVHIKAPEDSFALAAKKNLLESNVSVKVTTDKIIYNILTKKFHD